MEQGASFGFCKDVAKQTIKKWFGIRMLITSILLVFSCIIGKWILDAISRISDSLAIYNFVFDLFEIMVILSFCYLIYIVWIRLKWQKRYYDYALTLSNGEMAYFTHIRIGYNGGYIEPWLDSEDIRYYIKADYKYVFEAVTSIKETGRYYVLCGTFRKCNMDSEKARDVTKLKLPKVFVPDCIDTVRRHFCILDV